MVMTGNMMTRVMRAMMTTTATSRKGAHLILKDILSQHELINVYFHSKNLSKCLITNTFPLTASQNIMNMDMAIMMKPITIMVRNLSDLQFCLKQHDFHFRLFFFFSF